MYRIVVVITLQYVTFFLTRTVWYKKSINVIDRPLNEAKVKVATMVSVLTAIN